MTPDAAICYTLTPLAVTRYRRRWYFLRFVAISFYCYACLPRVHFAIDSFHCYTPLSRYASLRDYYAAELSHTPYFASIY